MSERLPGPSVFQISRILLLDSVQTSSAGNVEAYTQCTLKAMLRHMESHIHWPGPLARQRM